MGVLSGRASRGFGRPVVRSGGAVRRGYLLWVGQMGPVIAVEVLVAAGSGGGRHLHAGGGLFVGERVVGELRVGGLGPEFVTELLDPCLYLHV